VTFPTARRLPAIYHPAAVMLQLPPRLAERIALVEVELRGRAASDHNGCSGYFPALTGVRGIDSDLPASREFVTSLPFIRCRGVEYQFNFLRLSVTQQSVDPAYHLDSDASTALSGDVTTLRQRRVGRLLLNLDAYNPRTVHFLDVDPRDVDLVTDGSYVRSADPSSLADHALIEVIPPRRGAEVAGLLLVANRVLHSGVDDAEGHFVGAYGVDAPQDVASTGSPP
jgi:hypothetical protein